MVVDRVVIRGIKLTLTLPLDTAWKLCNRHIYTTTWGGRAIDTSSRPICTLPTSATTCQPDTLTLLQFCTLDHWVFVEQSDSLTRLLFAEYAFYTLNRYVDLLHWLIGCLSHTGWSSSASVCLDPFGWQVCSCLLATLIYLQHSSETHSHAHTNTKFKQAK
ncbi:hypothetical protein E3P92_01734 [Wallemia ichthyophaga]|uniref:Uncharacterized protein n=1 Tax=Wallemia ichthyophaga TaxID=245174 RepID=A0A4T0HHN3_WALIC|nr:hypothetical protein E3P96_00223 [Wallemia ichthyophaga]TIB14352.1 hypothetical protein E3P90_01280 [Wallemia ichthyophaga]TIB15229.1 hypothetical protein E3P92_01734 [Wallemia ichthyophaga]TIB16209.1 hypothetical protein E3P93_01031 [Wallemia ichthyophaga]TIB24394.1 hypothetical protein E3P89_00985 [Wallemia ichthyophaga]